MTNANSTILKLMYILFWIAFIGLCIKTGSLLFSFTVSLLVNNQAAGNLFPGFDLLDLLTYSKTHYIIIVSILILLTGMKAYIAYLAIKVFMKFNLEKPFSVELTNFFLKISHVALGTGVLAILAKSYGQEISKNGVNIPIEWGGSEILFFSGVIYLLAMVFKKGADLQHENDLTV